MAASNDLDQLRQMPVNSYMWRVSRPIMAKTRVAAREVNPRTGKVVRYPLRQVHPSSFPLYMFIAFTTLLGLLMASTRILLHDLWGSPLLLLALVALSVALSAGLVSAKVISPALAKFPIDEWTYMSHGASWMEFKLNHMKGSGEKSLQLYSNALWQLSREKDDLAVAHFIHNGGLGKAYPEWEHKQNMRDMFTALARQPIKGEVGELLPPPPTKRGEISWAQPRTPGNRVGSSSPRKVSTKKQGSFPAPRVEEATSIQGFHAATMEDALGLDPRLGPLPEIMKHGDKLDEWSRWNLESIQGEVLRSTGATLAIINSPLATKGERREARQRFSSTVEIVLPQLERLRSTVVASLSRELESSGNFLRDKFGEPGERLRL